ncbi:PorV/PorQ family protein [Porphyromonas sp.]|uniref:PorV/PorQ family protein n=1 Tax=Porphyromonas sp. TaxID=1924944 RepID=UPI0026DBC085|nr:PorV/PorQ family protein [Porphyromonas sp.]MDO4770944.1 PorV/PorQ family protein [Porphyromonas sp.]
MYKNIIKKGLLFATLSVATSLVASAQVAAPHRLFELNPDVASHALGGTHLVTNSNNYIYANPTNIFRAEKSFTLYVSGEYLPKFADMKRESFGSLSAGYRFNERHALFAGLRMLSGLKLNRVNDLGTETEERLLRPSQMTFDAGYAFAFSENISAFATLSMLRSTTGQQTQSFFAGVGVNYTRTLQWMGKETHFRTTLAGYNLGEDVDFGKGMSYRLPSTVALGLGATMELTENQSLGLQAQVARITSYSDTQLGAGVEYSFLKMFSLRGGYQYYDKDVSFASVGAGLTIGRNVLGVAYRIGMGEYTKNSIACSFSINF